MTETEWDTCTEPMRMLRLLRGRVSYQIARLFPQACYWSVLELLCGDFAAQQSSFVAAHENLRRCELIREIFRYPLQPLPELDPAWLAWGGGGLRRLAAATGEEPYSEGQYRFLLLGDALEEAGCTDAVILAHCRAGGPHLRGCWVVDWIMGND
jgi:hypothetical protein